MKKNYMEIREYAMREIEENDLPQLLSWRNSPEIHAKMRTNHIITWEEHLSWFKKVKENNPPLNFAFTYKENLAGYLGYTSYDSENKTCDVGDYLGVGLALPVDAGAVLGEMLLRYAFYELKIEKIITDVFIDNRRIYKLVRMTGFKIIEENIVQKDGKPRKLAKLELKFADWQANNV